MLVALLMTDASAAGDVTPLIFAPDPGSTLDPSPYWLWALYLVGTVHPVGSREPYFSIETTAGSFASLLRLEDNEESLAIVQADVLHHYRHGAPPQFPTPRTSSSARLLSALFEEYLFIHYDLDAALDELERLAGSAPSARELDAAVDALVPVNDGDDWPVLNAPLASAGRSGSGHRVTATSVGQVLGARWYSNLRVTEDRFEADQDGTGREPGAVAGPGLALEVRARPSCDGQLGPLLFLSTTSAEILRNAYPDVYDIAANVPGTEQCALRRHAGSPIPPSLSVRALLVAHRKLRGATVESLVPMPCFVQPPHDPKHEHAAEEVPDCNAIAERLKAAWDQIREYLSLELAVSEAGVARACTARFNQPTCARELADEFERATSELDSRGDRQQPPPISADQSTQTARKPNAACILATHPWLSAHRAGKLETALYERYEGDAGPGASAAPVDGHAGFWRWLLVQLISAGLTIVLGFTVCLSMSRTWARTKGTSCDDGVGKGFLRWSALLAAVIVPLLLYWALRASAWIAVHLSSWADALWFHLIAVPSPVLLVLLCVACWVQWLPWAIPRRLWSRRCWYLLLRLRYSALNQRLIWLPFSFVVLWALVGGCLIWGVEFFADTVKPESKLLTGGILKASISIFQTLLINQPTSLRSEWSETILMICRYLGLFATGLVSAYVLRVLVRYLNRGPRLLIVGGEPTSAGSGRSQKSDVRSRDDVSEGEPSSIFSDKVRLADYVNRTIDVRYYFEAHEVLSHPGAENKPELTHRCRTPEEGLFLFDFLNTRAVVLRSDPDGKVNALLAEVRNGNKRSRPYRLLVWFDSAVHRLIWSVPRTVLKLLRSAAAQPWTKSREGVVAPSAKLGRAVIAQLRRWTSKYLLEGHTAAPHFLTRLFVADMPELLAAAARTDESSEASADSGRQDGLRLLIRKALNLAMIVGFVGVQLAFAFCAMQELHTRWPPETADTARPECLNDG
jgi:hypothetical protein